MSNSSPSSKEKIFNGFKTMLNAHYDRLPFRYESAVSHSEDVLVHMWLLRQAEESHKLEHEIWVSEKQASSSYKVAFAGSYESNRHTQLSSAISNCKLGICNEDSFQTSDGYSLDLFLVQGWHGSDPGEFSHVLKVAIAKKEEAKLYRDKEIDLELLDIREQISYEPTNLYRGTYRGQEIVMKKLLLIDEALFVPSNFWKGMEILSGLGHPNVVLCLGANTKDGLRIVTEYMPGGNLHDYLKKNHEILTLSQRLKLAVSISKGVEYLHDKLIIHKNLNSSNLLLDKDDDVKVDISSALYMDWAGMMKTRRWCRWTAQEAVKQGQYGDRLDVYSFGMVLWQILTAKVPYEDLDSLSARQTFTRVLSGLRPEIPVATNPKLKKVIEDCLDGDAMYRSHISQVRVDLELILSQVNTPTPTPTSTTTWATPTVPHSMLPLRNRFHCLANIE